MSPETVLTSLPAFSTHVTSTLGRSPQTAKAYVSDVRCLARFLHHPSAAAVGAATELATAFVAWLRVDERNGPALALYRSAGFKPVNETVREGAIRVTPQGGASSWGAGGLEKPDRSSVGYAACGLGN